MTEQTPTPASESPKASHRPPNGVSDQKPYYARPFVVIGVAIITGLLFFLCFEVSGGLNAASLQLFVTGFVGFLTLIVIAAQAEIYQRQARFMREGLEKTESLIKQNERIIGEMKTQREINETQIAQTASQLIIARDQTVQMIDQREVMQGQLDAMERQATIALRQFEITDRPWLTVNITPTSPLTFNDQGASLRFMIFAKNIGRSVAINATINAKIVIPKLGGNVWAAVLTEQATICQNINSNWMSYALFPDEVYPVDIGFQLSAEELEAGRLEDGFDFIQFYIVGCSDYQFSGHETHHQTRFIYEINRTEPDRPGIGGLSIGNDVPLERLLLQKMFIGGGDYAD